METIRVIRESSGLGRPSEVMEKLGLTVPAFIKTRERALVTISYDFDDGVFSSDFDDFTSPDLRDVYRRFPKNEYRLQACESLWKAPGCKAIGNHAMSVGPRMVGVAEANGRMAAMLFNPIEDKDRIAAAYLEFLKIREEWQEKPKDFLRAYKFISSHPIFWTEAESIWFTEMDPRALVTTVFEADDQGTPLVCIEPRVPLDHEGSNSVFDPLLAGHGKTYEKAILKVAQHLERQYDEKGDPRHGGGLKNAKGTHLRDIIALTTQDNDETR